MRTAMIASALAFGLAGCETGNNLLGGNTMPGPQAAVSDAQQPAATSNAQTARVEIAPIIGAPEAVARDLQGQLTGAIERNKISVAKAPGSKGEYVLRGYIVAAREKTGSKISYIWDVTDQTGKRANRITGEEFSAGAPGKDPWSSVTPQTIQSIADKTASQIATWLPGATGIPVASNTSAPALAAPATSTAASVSGASATEPFKTAQATATQSVASQSVASQAIAATPAVASAVTPAATNAALTTPATASKTAALETAAAASTTGSIENGTSAIVVPSVSGAPGDGSTSLTGAIQRELTKNGVNLASAPNPQAYKVEGKVAVGQGKDGKQPIQIDWNVIDPKGKKLGTVSQKNEVPQGSLDGAWGKTADIAAQAAAQGILKLLPQQKAVN